MNQLGQVSRDQAVAAVSDVRERLSEIVDEVSSTGSDIVITKHGRPAAVLLGFEDYESLIETVNILSDSAVMAALAEAENDLETGDLVPLD
jgi:prevent-host-death family protein